MSEKSYLVKFDTDKIDILSVRVIKASIDSMESESFNFNDISGFKYSWNVSNSLDMVDKLVRIVFSVTIFANDHEDRMLQTSGQFSIEYVYKVDNLYDFLLPDSTDEVPLVHGVLSSNLFAIAYSTSRGIILTRCNGTILQGVMLPVVSPLSMSNH